MTTAPDQHGSYPTPGSPTSYPASQAAPGTNGLAIAGLILAIFVFPVGLVLSVVGLIQARRKGQKGKGLAILGILIALGELALVIAVVVFFGQNATTLVDPGCVKAKQVILKDGDLGQSSDPAVLKSKLQTVLSGLDAAAAAAEHDNVRSTVKALRADFAQLQDALNTGQEPAAGLQDKVTADANAVDNLCTLGGAQK
ncbi:MAG TPA: DUF4190 domain-containing protein [Kineosporiaceae bacterium]|nr:DUF4190 domain-containing protein [Kineosporiaceae bacterium]